MRLNYSINGRDFPLTASLINAVEEALSKSHERYGLMYTDVVLSRQGDSFHVRLSSRSAEGTSAVVSGESKDCYDAISIANKRLGKRIEKSLKKKARRISAPHCADLETCA